MLNHKSVLVKEIINLLNHNKPGLYLDCTFGGGGHSEAILKKNLNNKVIAIDADSSSITKAKSFELKFNSRFNFHCINFGELNRILEKNFTGILFDLGISSLQLDDANRGFSFQKDAPIDMRINQMNTISAAEFLKKSNYYELVQAIRDYGEEKQWKKIVTSILQKRLTNPIESTRQLSDLIINAIDCIPFKKKKIHPATKTFQGIRIAVNKELEMLTKALPIAFNKLKKGGLLMVISFHSLEDRIVKRFFKAMSGMPEHKKDNRFQDQRNKYASLLVKKPIVANDLEILENPRSRSAKLRILVKE